MQIPTQWRYGSGGPLGYRWLVPLLWVTLLCWAPLSAQAQQTVGSSVATSSFDVDTYLSTLDISSQNLRKLNRKVSVSLDDVTLEQALQHATSKGQLGLSYSRALVPLQKRLSVDMENVTVLEAIFQIIEGTDLIFKLSASGQLIVVRDPEAPAPALAPPVAPALMHLVSGTVTSSGDNAPLPGVNIQVKGTILGTATDVNGAYSLDAPAPNDTLVFSFVGFITQEVPINGRAVIDVALEESAAILDDVVVVGYGSVPKMDLTGSVASVDAEAIANLPFSRLDQALQGTAAGVWVTSVSGAPNARSTIRIRGSSSIRASNEPLYVIDGFIVGTNYDLSSINANDIESIEILKDAVATSIYGARAANGVILVTTKSGTAGRPRLNVNAYTTVQRFARKIELLNGPERAQYYQEQADLLGIPGFPIDPADAVDTDWQEEISQIGQVNNIEFNLSGGGRQSRYYISGGYFDQVGIIRNSGFERYQLRVNLDNSITNKLKASTRLNLSRSDTDPNNTDFFQTLKNAATYLPVFDEDGGYNRINFNTGATFRNPVADVELRIGNEVRNRLLGQIGLEYEFFQGLSVRSNWGSDLSYQKNNTYTPGVLPDRLVRGLGGAANVSTSTTVQILNENTVTFDRDFGVHGVNAVAGFTWQQAESEWVGGSAAGFSNDALLFNNLGAGDPLRENVWSGFSDFTLASWLSRVNYSFRDRYRLTLVGRLDGSSRLGENDKYAFFPAGAVAWTLSEEPFIRNLRVFDHLKLRASYGFTGEQGVAIYSTLPVLNTGRVFFNETESPSVSQGRIANPGLKWETTRQLDIGLEAGFFEGRLFAELDYYRKNTEDLLLTKEIPFQTSFSGRLVNLGETQNQGIDLSVQSVNIDRGGFTWSTTFNVSGNRSKVVDIGDSEFLGSAYASFWGFNVGRLIPGEPVNTFVGAVYEGVWQSQQEIDAAGTMPNAVPGAARWRDADGNGIFEGTPDFVVIGNAEPDFFGGVVNTFQYKGLALEVFFQGTYGNDVMNSFNEFLLHGGRAFNTHKEALNRWTPGNTDTDIPAAGANDLDGRIFSNTVLVEDGSHLRLKTIRLSYELPASKWFNDRIRSLNVYVVGNNLWLLSDYRGYDPEVNTAGTNSVVRGLDNLTYPKNRSFTFGVNIGF